MLASSSLEVVATFSSPSFVSKLMAVSLRQYRGFDPSGSLQLPIKESDRDHCSISLRQMACFFFCFILDRRIENSEFLLVGFSLVKSEHVVFDPIVHSLMLCFFLWLQEELKQPYLGKLFSRSY